MTMDVPERLTALIAKLYPAKTVDGEAGAAFGAFSKAAMAASREGRTKQAHATSRLSKNCGKSGTWISQRSR
jgi:hypothetical protein